VTVSLPVVLQVSAGNQEPITLVCAAAELHPLARILPHYTRQLPQSVHFMLPWHQGSILR